jgi:hypothetical protein
MAVNYPEHRKRHCPECGEKTVTNCTHCNSDIRGYHDIPGVIGFFNYTAPNYCENCGQPFPWTERKTHAARELIALADTLNDEEMWDLQRSITDLIKGGPEAVVAQAKYKKYIAKAGSEIAKGLRDILVDMVSETVKKAIWGI